MSKIFEFQEGLFNKQSAILNRIRTFAIFVTLSTVLAVSQLAALPLKVSATPIFTEFPLLGHVTEMIATGPDGAVWYKDDCRTGICSTNDRYYISRISNAGVVTSFELPFNVQIGNMVSAPDGALWFTEMNSDRSIGRISTDGQITYYPMPVTDSTPFRSTPYRITLGPDGALWFTVRFDGPNKNSIGRITTSGEVTIFPLPTVYTGLYGITTGPDGALWVTEMYADKIGRMTTDGQFTEYPIRTVGSTGSSNIAPLDIIPGPDGALWFDEVTANKIGRITTDGTVTEFETIDNAQPTGIVTGSDGNLWYIEGTAEKVSRMTPQGVVTDYSVPNIDGNPYGFNPGSITSGSDGNIWFSASNGLDSYIAKLDLAALATTAAPTNLNSVSPTALPKLNWDESTGAVSYNIYRNGAIVGSSSATNFTDNAALSESTYDYYVTAVGSSTESAASNTVQVLVDKTAPAVSNVNWSANPLLRGQNTTLSALVTDGPSGVSSVKYSLDGAAPVSMTYDNVSGTWKAILGANLAVNTYNVTISATDQAGNTNTGATDVLAVYDTANGYVTGHANIIPNTSDVLPIARDTSSNPTKLTVGFTNATSPASGSFDINYVIKNNKDEFNISSTGINWIVVQNSTHASILGHADLTTYVNGVKTMTQNVSVRFDITLGVNGAPDQVSVKVFNPGVDPNSSTSIYTVNDVVIANGSNLMIHP